MNIGVLTISDRVAKGEMEDRGGAAIVAYLTEMEPNAKIVIATLPDERGQISDQLRHWSDQDHLDVIITTGGTGLGPRDVTPEATSQVIDKRVPGIEEALRERGRRNLPAAMLSRGLAGARGATLIVNLPGSPNGAREGIEVIAAVVRHAVDLLHGNTRHGAVDVE